ncbi:MAG: undecaprenyldiphospho-muramoylpentapeptide beta-N-acetylglucosaminyltransferase [Nitrospirales bacterium]
MKIVIAAGGTGGHLYPAVALAREFIREEPETGVLFVGTARGIEAGVLCHEGFELQSIKALPFMGVGLGGALCALRALPVGLWQSLRILRTRRPDVVIAIGGYGSPAVIIAAFLLRIPRVLLEPNAYAGLANRVLSPFAHRVFVAFESATSGFSRRKVRVVGSPIRREFMQQGGDASRVARNGRSVLLVFGGSQGARPINDAMIEALPYLGSLRERMEVVHQTGEADRQRVQDAYQGAGFRAQVLPFLFDMPQRLQAATLVVARAGAITLAEITASGRVAVLIPLPHAIYDHQAHNAQVLESVGAAMVVPQSVLSGERLAGVITDLLSDPERLRQMGERSRGLGRTDSAEVIVRECMTLVKKRSAVSDQPTAQR